MKKKCLIFPTMPITCFNIPIVNNTELCLTEEEIYKCLCSKAQVQEILSNGKLINLDFTNYNTDNDIRVISVDVVKESSDEELDINCNHEKIDITEVKQYESSIDLEEIEEESSDKEIESDEDLTKTDEMQSRNNVKNKKNKNRR